MTQDGRKQLTIKDIAQLANVSVSTVSNVLNGTGRPSKETSEKVLKIVRQTKFNLNASARTLRRRTSHIIGVLVPSLGTHDVFDLNPFYWEFVNGVRVTVEAHGYDVILKTVDVNADVSILLHRDLDGIIVVGAYDNNPFTESVIAAEIPAVFVDSYLTFDHVNTVNLDNRFGAYLAVRHLLGLGHRHITFIGGQLRSNGIDDERYQGYRHAIHENGEETEAEVIEAEVSLEGGRTTAHQMVYSGHRCTGIVTTSDVLAIGLIKGFYECGINVPRDISIVGFDDIEYSGYTIPALTTIHQDVFERAREASRLLLQVVDRKDGDDAQQIRVQPRLVVRESTAPVSE